MKKHPLPFIRIQRAFVPNFLRQEEKAAIWPLLDHAPARAAPLVGFFDQKVRRKPEIDQSRLHFIAALFELHDRLIKVLRPDDHARIDTPLGVALSPLCWGLFLRISQKVLAFFLEIR